MSPEGSLASSISLVRVGSSAGGEFVLVRALIRSEETVSAMDEEALFLAVWSEVSARYGLHTAPAARHVARFAHVLPELDADHGARVERIGACLDRLPGLALASSTLYGAGISNCIAGVIASRRVLNQ